MIVMSQIALFMIKENTLRSDLLTRFKILRLVSIIVSRNDGDYKEMTMIHYDFHWIR